MRSPCCQLQRSWQRAEQLGPGAIIRGASKCLDSGSSACRWAGNLGTAASEDLLAHCVEVQGGIWEAVEGRGCTQQQVIGWAAAQQQRACRVQHVHTTRGRHADGGHQQCRAVSRRGIGIRARIKLWDRLTQAKSIGHLGS
eukprot:scaffold117955_cov99-Phaeocystis_antarctica.AAC.5